MSWAYYLWIIPVLLLLVLVHEFGHYLTARLFGVRVKEFAFGFPPRVGAVRVGETEYAFNAIPLGGYVRMEGEDGDVHSPASFAAHPRWQRAIILVAGASMNLLIVPLLLTAVALVGEPTPDGAMVIQAVQPDSPAQHAGLHPGDVIYQVNGVTISSEKQLEDLIDANLGRSLTLVISPDGTRNHTEAVNVTPRVQVGPNQGHVGIEFSPHVVPVSQPIWQAPVTGVQQTATLLGAFFGGIRQMFGSADVQLSGPVGITKITGEAAHAGPSPLIELTALLSINLAIINLLPFPALDGGRLAVLALERLRGRRLDPRLEGTIHFIGFVLLISLMLAVSFHEVVNPPQ